MSRVGAFRMTGGTGYGGELVAVLAASSYAVYTELLLGANAR